MVESVAAAVLPMDQETRQHLLCESEPAEGLTRREHEILVFERQWWKFAGVKEAAIKELFDLSATRYYQVLNSLIDTPQALAFDPMLVKRLRRLRATRQKARAARMLGIRAD